MRYVSFRQPDGTPSCGRLSGTRITALAGDLKSALEAENMSELQGVDTFDLADVELLPVIPNPGKILCVGLNYAAHVAEMGRAATGHPAIFTRWADTLVAPGKPLIRPRESTQFDYEGELAVIIGKPGRRIARADALAHIAGFSVFQDASVRDWQNHNSQFTPGKNFPATASLGPALVTPDEVGELGSQRVTTRLNGAVVQDQPVSDMIWDIPFIIAYISSFTALNPGDVIATGTPGGVGVGRKPPLFLQDGDRVEVTIGTIGTLANPVVAEG